MTDEEIEVPVEELEQQPPADPEIEGYLGEPWNQTDEDDQEVTDDADRSDDSEDFVQ